MASGRFSETGGMSLAKKSISRKEVTVCASHAVVVVISSRAIRPF